MTFHRSLAILPLLLLTGSAAAQSIEQMAGQMIVVGFEGDDAGDASVLALRDELAAGTIGGVMYLKKNVKSLEDVRAMNQIFRAASPELLPFITLDQEGGSVERLTADVGFAEIPNAATIADSKTPEEAQAVYGTMAAAIADLGFSVNFGPVADLNINPDNQVITKFGRSYGADPARVAAYDGAFIAAHHGSGVLTALKHFPGHGSSTADSHEGFVDITQTWQIVELEPYKALMAQGLVDMVMVGHLYHADHSEPGEQNPASLSRLWISGVLRSQLKYNGVVISDDLEMGAIRDHFSTKQTVVKAVRAGVDVLLFSNTGGQEILDILVTEAEGDPAFAALIAASYQRIVTLKQRIG